MADDGFPIIDPDTGEVLAGDDAERVEVVELCGLVLVEEANVRARADEARRKLRVLMREGEARGLGGGWGVSLQPPATPPRQVVKHALEAHAEALRPLGVAPREVTKTEVVLPKVSDLTSKAVKAGLVRLGLSLDEFLHKPEPGPAKVVLVPPERP